MFWIFVGWCFDEGDLCVIVDKFFLAHDFPNIILSTNIIIS